MGLEGHLKNIWGVTGVTVVTGWLLWAGISTWSVVRVNLKKETSPLSFFSFLPCSSIHLCSSDVTSADACGMDWISQDGGKYRAPYGVKNWLLADVQQNMLVVAWYWAKNSVIAWCWAKNVGCCLMFSKETQWNFASLGWECHQGGELCLKQSFGQNFTRVSQLLRGHSLLW